MLAPDGAAAHEDVGRPLVGVAPHVSEHGPHQGCVAVSGEGYVVTEPIFGLAVGRRELGLLAPGGAAAHEDVGRPLGNVAPDVGIGGSHQGRVAVVGERYRCDSLGVELGLLAPGGATAHENVGGFLSRGPYQSGVSVGGEGNPPTEIIVRFSVGSDEFGLLHPRVHLEGIDSPGILHDQPHLTPLAHHPRRHRLPGGVHHQHLPVDHFPKAHSAGNLVARLTGPHHQHQRPCSRRAPKQGEAVFHAHGQVPIPFHQRSPPVPHLVPNHLGRCRLHRLQRPLAPPGHQAEAHLARQPAQPQPAGIPADGPAVGRVAATGRLGVQGVVSPRVAAQRLVQGHAQGGGQLGPVGRHGARRQEGQSPLRRGPPQARPDPDDKRREQDRCRVQIRRGEQPIDRPKRTNHDHFSLPPFPDKMTNDPLGPDEF